MLKTSEVDKVVKFQKVRPKMKEITLDRQELKALNKNNHEEALLLLV